MRDVPLSGNRWPAESAVDVSVSPATGDCLVLVDGVRDASFSSTPHDEPAVYEEVAGRSFRVTAGGFWQVHPGAANVLRAAVLDALEPEPGDSAVDLYGGVGLFADALAERVGPTSHGAPGRATGWPWPTPGTTCATATSYASSGVVSTTFCAGAACCTTWTSWSSTRPARVPVAPLSISSRACGHGGSPTSPATQAALARDLKFFADRGHVLADLRAFDLFPMTHHVECVATLTRG